MKFLIAPVLLLGLFFSTAHAQYNNLNWYNCNGVFESVPPNPPGMTSPAPGVWANVCGPDLQYAQQIANSFLAGSNTPYGYKTVAQCSINWEYQNYCMAPGLQ